MRVLDDETGVVGPAAVARAWHEPATVALVLALGLTTPGARGAELVGHATLHPDTFAPGPPAGAHLGERPGPPRFPAQPVQGFSALRALSRDAFLALLDNGFGTQANSRDSLLRVYTIRPDPRTAAGGTGTIAVDYAFVELRDPDRRLDFPLVNGSTAERLLTGADLDPESLVVAGDGTLWIGEEIGPFLLQFDATGRLLTAPIQLPDPRPGRDPQRHFVRSPENPYLPAMSPGEPPAASLDSSNGVESLALAADGTRLYAMLEGPLAGDPPDRALILELELASRRFTGRSWAYRKPSVAGLPAHSRSHLAVARDMATVNAHQMLVLEGDNAYGTVARHKKVVLIDLDRVDGAGHVARTEVADLLDVRDPSDLAGLGPRFTFPYASVEALSVLDPTTIVVVNDNNFPKEGARRPGIRDPTELLVLALDRPLDLDPRLVVPRDKP